MSNINVMDASAVLAYLQGEPGAELLEEAFDQRPSWMSCVNYCETIGKLSEKGMPLDQAAAAIAALGLRLADFDPPLAMQAAAMRKVTLPIGASLGDRACLALAQKLLMDAYTPIVFTADQSWTRLKWPFDIVLTRPALRRSGMR